MQEITFNEETNDEEINYIAIDLGSTNFSKFENNKPYAVNQLNQITADLVGKGVLRTEANGALGCEVTSTDGKAYVQKGVIVFGDGAKIRIKEPVEIEIIPNAIICATHDPYIGTAQIEISSVVPISDYVLLAEVDAEGVIIDRRSGCVAKTSFVADVPNTYTEMQVEHLCAGTYEEFVIDVGTAAFSYIFIGDGSWKYGTQSKKWSPYYQNGFYLAEGEETTVIMATNGVSTILNFTKEGQRLNVMMDNGVKNATYTLKIVAM